MFKIKNPCPKRWEDMEDLDGEKFCSSCQKKVFIVNNFTNKNLIAQNICGKITKISPAFSGLFLAFSLATTSCQPVLPATTNISEKTYKNQISIIGNIFSKEKRTIISSKITLINLANIYTATGDSQGNFSLTIPEKVIGDHNVVRIDYTIVDDNGKNFTDHTTSIIPKSELFGLENFQIENKFVTIGALYLTDYEPPDLYYFDGKKLSKRKFNKIKTENPTFANFVIYNEVIARQLSGKSDFNNLYLLFSN